MEQKLDAAAVVVGEDNKSPEDLQSRTCVPREAVQPTIRGSFGDIEQILGDFPELPMTSSTELPLVIALSEPVKAEQTREITDALAICGNTSFDHSSPVSSGGDAQEIEASQSISTEADAAALPRCFPESPINVDRPSATRQNSTVYGLAHETTSSPAFGLVSHSEGPSTSSLSLSALISRRRQRLATQARSKLPPRSVSSHLNSRMLSMH